MVDVHHVIPGVEEKQIGRLQGHAYGEIDLHGKMIMINKMHPYHCIL